MSAEKTTTIDRLEALAVECVERNRGSPIAPIKALVKLAAVMCQYLSSSQRMEIAEFTRTQADMMERRSVPMREK